MAQEVTWYGKSGTGYSFKVCGLDAKWKDIGGVYIFAKVVGDKWSSIYIGQTSSFKDRLTASHEKWDCAVGVYGATHIHARVETNEDRRLLIESDLIAIRKQMC